jgi:hypothetical protein
VCDLLGREAAVLPPEELDHRPAGTTLPIPGLLKRPQRLCCPTLVRHA